MRIAFGRRCATGSAQITPLETAALFINLRVKRLDVALIQRRVLLVPGVRFVAARVEQQDVVETPVVLASLLCVVVGRLALPHQLIDEIVLAQNLIEHHFDVVRRVPLCVDDGVTRHLTNPPCSLE